MNKQTRWLIRLGTLGYCCYMFYFASTFRFMALNVFLGYLPIELSFHIKKGHSFYFLSFFWLLFYPNAPYLLTDFFHLEMLSIYQKNNEIFGNSLQAWWSFSLLVVGIIPYYFYGAQSMLFFVTEWRQRKPWINHQWLLIILINFLASLAIYIGRFERFHSIYLFIQPFQTVRLVFFDWSWNKMIFILIFTFLQSVLLFVFFGGQIQEKEKLY